MSPAPAPLTESELADALASLDGWTVADGKLHKEYLFGDFVSAFAFMTAAALCAERADHHPEWRNVYGRVTVDLTTHVADAITQRDVDLAREFDRAAARP
jgi:4a-hydroxytetrahydrobiopterin dehydratase